MRDFKKTRGRRAQYLRMAGGLAAMALLVVVAAGVADAAWGMYGKFIAAAAADAASQQELSALQGQYDGMSASVAQLSTAHGAAAAVRERYGVGLPGEGEIDIIRTATSSAAGAPAQDGFWAGLWRAVSVF
jgi:hypothetical protein